MGRNVHGWPVPKRELPEPNNSFKVTRLQEIKWCWFIPVQCNNVLWNQEGEWATDLQRLESISVVPFANSFPMQQKITQLFHSPLIKSDHFYKQIPKANQNILEVLKCWFTSCSSHKGNKGLEIKTVFMVLSKMGKEIMATQTCLDKLCFQFGGLCLVTTLLYVC